MRFSKTSKSAVSEKLPRVIFVEGKDDAYFVDALLDELGADPTEVGVIFVEGQSNLAPELRLLFKSAAYVRRETRAIALLRDSDADPVQKVAEIHADLLALGLPTPAHNEIISYDQNRTLGLFLVPAGDEAGELEDLLLSCVENDERLQIVTSALEQVENLEGPLDKRSKRVARMYISVLPIKPCGVGRAYREGVFDQACVKVALVRVFLQNFLL